MRSTVPGSSYCRDGEEEESVEVWRLDPVTRKKTGTVSIKVFDTDVRLLKEVLDQAPHHWLLNHLHDDINRVVEQLDLETEEGKRAKEVVALRRAIERINATFDPEDRARIPGGTGGGER